MTGRPSALAILGLRPGADAAAIERAYKQLIKQHHPDRAGGDAKRAADINRAYRELRGKAATHPLQFNDDLRAPHRGWRWRVAIIAAAAGLAALMLAMGPSVPLTRTLWAARAQLPMHSPAMKTPRHVDAMDGPLHMNAIDSAIQRAVQMFHTKDEFALASESRDCQRRLLENPGTEMLDACAAFDEAVVGLENRDPLRDEGPFAPLAVTGREWSAASALSEDDLAIDGRLDRIRLRVELALAPQVPPQSGASN